MSLPQFRVRTEFTFRNAYGKVDLVADRLKSLGSKFAVMVDEGGAWGHPKWEAACAARGIVAGFGLEPRVDWAPRGKLFAVARGEFASGLYRMATLSERGMLDLEAAASADGVLWFATGDVEEEVLSAIRAELYLDPGSPISIHRTKRAAKRLGLVPVMVSDNFYPSPEDRSAFQLIDRPREKPTQQHILSEDELREACAMSAGEARASAAKMRALMAEIGSVKLKKAPMIRADGSLEKLVQSGLKHRGFGRKLPPEYAQRLTRELQLIKEKDFESYFIIVADLVQWAKKRMLVGPARGSAAGSLVCWLLGITEVDPIRFGLIFERFIDITRSDFPDIDLDFNDEKRDEAFEYLKKKYGAENFARLGTVSDLKPKSILALAMKKFDLPANKMHMIRDSIIVRSSADSRAMNCVEDTLKETLLGREILRDYPHVAAIFPLEGHASHTGIHAAGAVICNEPIANYGVVSADGVLQLDKYDAEKLGLLKVDILGLRTLSILEDVPGVDWYRLPLDDAPTFDIFNKHRWAGVFQWEGVASQQLSLQVKFESLENLAHLTALARPGPFQSGASGHYVRRFNKQESPTPIHPSLKGSLEETLGLFVYQEQVMNICRDVGKFSWEDVTVIRKAMSKTMGREFFDKNFTQFAIGAASIGIAEAEARKIWDEMCTFGAWGFNKSHAISYAILSYWTAYAKAHHPLEFACSALKRAKDNDHARIILREFVGEGLNFVALDPMLSEENWSVKDGKLLGGFMGVRGIGPAKAKALVENRGKWTAAQERLIASAQSEFADLNPAQTKWGEIYRDPQSFGISSRVVCIEDLKENESSVFLGVLEKKVLNDMNEPMRVKKRQGRLIKNGPTAFLDIKLRDDTALITARIDRYDFETIGKPILEKGAIGKDWFIVRGRKIPNFNMLHVEKISWLQDFLQKRNSAKGSALPSQHTADHFSTSA